MLNIAKRLEVIQALLDEDSCQSLTYAALECRLTLELLCYERFKLSYEYLSMRDLKSWQPRHVIKQVSEDVNDDICKGFTISICKNDPTAKSPETVEDFQALDYTYLGTQVELNINNLHKIWHGLSNVALHIPVSSILSDKIHIYGEKEKIKSKVEVAIRFLKELEQGNLLVGGVLCKTYQFNCFICHSLIKKSRNLIKEPKLVNCINPDCIESYVVEEDQNNTGEVFLTRRVIKFDCNGCKRILEVPANVFYKLKFEQVLNIKCPECGSSQEIKMHPLKKPS